MYEARDRVLQRRVLIRMLSPRLAVTPEIRERFRDHVQLAGGLLHPHIATVFDVGEHEERPYVVMEFFEGSDLEGLLGGARQPSHAWKLKVLTRVCEAMAHAHRRGVFHLALRPGNVWVTGDGDVKVLSFGFAALEAVTAMRSGLSPSDVRALAPEQVEGRPADARSDVFAIGVIAYELFTGRRAFAGESVPAVLHSIANTRPDPVGLPGTTAGAASPGIAPVVMRSLARRPDERYPCVEALLEDLEAAAWAGVAAAMEASDGAATVDPEAARVAMWLDEGGQLLQRGQPAEALRCARLALTLAPEDDRAQALAREAGRAAWKAKMRQTLRQVPPAEPERVPAVAAVAAAPAAEPGIVDLRSYILEQAEGGEPSQGELQIERSVAQVVELRRAAMATRLSRILAGRPARRSGPARPSGTATGRSGQPGASEGTSASGPPRGIAARSRAGRGAAPRTPAPVAGVRALTAVALRRFLQSDYSGARQAIEQALAIDPHDKKARELRTILAVAE